MNELDLITKKKIIQTLREDVRMIQDSFSNIYRARIDPTIKKVNIDDLETAIGTYHEKVPGSDYLYNLLVKCINELHNIRFNLRRHGEEYSLEYLEEYFNKVYPIFTETSDALIEEIIEINEQSNQEFLRKYEENI